MEKRYMVVPRTPAAQQKGIDTGKGHRDFGKQSALWVGDPAVAREIDDKYGFGGKGDVWVHEDPMYEWHLKHEGSDMTGDNPGRNHDIHSYTFGPTDSYAKAWEEFEKRRKDKKKGA
jgi:hypothetical protein